MKDIDDWFGGDFNPTPKQTEELTILDEIRDNGRMDDLIGDELLDRVAVLQGATPKSKHKKKT